MTISTQQYSDFTHILLALGVQPAELGALSLKAHELTGMTIMKISTQQYSDFTHILLALGVSPAERVALSLKAHELMLASYIAAPDIAAIYNRHSQKAVWPEGVATTAENVYEFRRAVAGHAPMPPTHR